MMYPGWNYEKTLLVRSPDGARENEALDVRVPVDARSAGALDRDVRVVLKKDWNIVDRELPSQAYRVTGHGASASFRVAFTTDVPAQGYQRIGILYDNPGASAAGYPCRIEVVRNGAGGTIRTPRYIVETDPRSGQIRTLDARFQIPSLEPRPVRYADLVQEGAAVVFAVEGRNAVEAVSASAADWTAPEIVEEMHGPLFLSRTRRGRLVPAGHKRPESCPDLLVEYRFFSDQPYFLVRTRLSFPSDTRVFGIYTGMLNVKVGRFTHYTFRPVSPNLPETDVEEMGHILVDPALTQGLPDGSAFGDLLPYDLAWHGFLNTKPGSRYGITSIQLRHEIASPSGFPYYRSAARLMRGGDSLCCLRAPVYAAVRDSMGTAVTIPAGTVIEETDAVVCDMFDGEWGERTDGLGRRLNRPVSVDLHPRRPGEEPPPGPMEALPHGSRAGAYARFGVR